MPDHAPLTACDREPATLPAILQQQAARQPDACALLWRGESRSYGALAARVTRLAARLATLGRSGDRVAVLAWNCPAYLELMYAVPAAGQVLVPINTRLAPAEWLAQLETAGVSTLFVGADLAAQWQSVAASAALEAVFILEEGEAQWLAGSAVDELPAIDPGQAAWMLFTSGSTGRPKAAVLTHASLLAGLRSAALGRPVASSDRFYYPFPLFHVAAHNVILQHRFGAAVVLAPRFDAGETLAACRELGVTTMSLAPTMIAMLLEHPSFSPRDLARVSTIGYGASAMPATLLERLLADTPVGLCQSYGMTELSGSVSFLTPADHRRAASGEPHLLRSVGRPLPTAQVRLVDPAGRSCATGDAGEVLVQAEQCMQGYWRDAPATREALRDGWLHTGDIGRFDDEGYLYLVDRAKDMIISGGENIASREVEDALRRHPAVRDCAVIGLPHPRWGEAVSAVLQLHRAVDDAELESHCRDSIAGYKTPRRWIRVDALPLNAAGKIDKPQLRRRYTAPSQEARIRGERSGKRSTP